jgi:hypothetical protein
MPTWPLIIHIYTCMYTKHTNWGFKKLDIHHATHYVQNKTWQAPYCKYGGKISGITKLLLLVSTHKKVGNPKNIGHKFNQNLDLCILAVRGPLRMCHTCCDSKTSVWIVSSKELVPTSCSGIQTRDVSGEIKNFNVWPETNFC